jgi:membrane dipeptidase
VTAAPRPIFDAHLDLAWNALSFGRDLTQSVEQIRQSEAEKTDHPSRGRNTVSLPELSRVGVRTCVATLLARSGRDLRLPARRHATDLDYASPASAGAAARTQLDYYHRLARERRIRLLRTTNDLTAHWNDPAAELGLIISMEGADPIVNPLHVQDWWDAGLRAIGLSHYGRGQYACGTGVDGPLTEAGVTLLREMERVGMILDVTHLSDRSMRQALDTFGGAVLASHHNCRALVPGDRQLADEQIRELASRGAVIGVALDAWMLHPNWTRGLTQPDVVSLSAAVDHIDHVCDLLGTVQHSGIGSDLDGGFGTEQTPRDLNTIADLQHLAPMLASRGYSDADIDAIFFGNWLRFFTTALPA